MDTLPRFFGLVQRNRRGSKVGLDRSAPPVQRFIHAETHCGDVGWKADVEGFNTDTFNIGGGAYLDDHSTLLVSYRFVEDEFDNTDHGLALDYKNVMPLQGDTALNIEAGIGFINTDLGDDVFSITGLLDYYFNPKFSLGGGLGYASADDDAFNYGIRAQYFFNSHVALAGSYDVVNADNFDVKTFAIGLRGRF